MRMMKESGIEWIGEIPEEWDIVRLKSLFDFGKGLPITKENLVDEGISVISYGQIHAKYNNGVSIDDRLLRYVPETYLVSNPASLVKTGDILVADTSEDLEGCGNAVQVDRDMNLFAGYHTIILHSRVYDDNRYIAYSMLTDNWRSQLRSRAVGVKLFSISKKMLSDCFFIFPPIVVQKTIANYLDIQCTHIDNIIEKTKASIEEYKNLRRAVITQAVTKGVHGDRAMKDSGIEWIGEIPKEWDVFRIASLYSERKENGNDELPILTVSINTGVSDRELSDDESERVFVRSEDRSKYMRVYPGDLTYNMMRAWQGAFGAVRVDGMVSPAYVIVKPRREIDSRYMEALLRTQPAKEEMKRYSHGIADFRLRLYWDKFRTIKVCLPPIEEQREIADYIDEKCAEIDALIVKKEQFLTELENYKKSMIYEYVTGKKEVPRNAAEN